MPSTSSDYDGERTKKGESEGGGEHGGGCRKGKDFDTLNSHSRKKQEERKRGSYRGKQISERKGIIRRATKWEERWFFAVLLTARCRSTSDEGIRHLKGRKEEASGLKGAQEKLNVSIESKITLPA